MQNGPGKPVERRNTAGFPPSGKRERRADHLPGSAGGEMYRRMQFGQKRERFEGDPNQTMLPFQAAEQEAECHAQLLFMRAHEPVKITSTVYCGLFSGSIR
ncbi:IS66 family transposase [Pontibacter diazotrophicus]|uniref:IS66 family transposase n=1 Tax=Pontibacter diazotrophicus TaxID=1400979 RepID=UPI00267F6971|nr:hypothetical protein [Pontibacter diazotrophicus]